MNWSVGGIVDGWGARGENKYYSNSRRFSADITPGEIPRHVTRYETEKNIVSGIARIELTFYLLG